MSFVSRAYFVSESNVLTDGDWSTSEREWRYPEAECTTTILGRSLFKAGIFVEAADCICFWKPAATKPGEARRIGLDVSSLLLLAVILVLNSIWRSNVSKVTWKNFDSPLHRVSRATFGQ